MKTPLCILAALAALLFTSTLSLTAGEARFFRVAGPVPVAITAISADGYGTWTNAPTNSTFTVQTSSSLQSQNNWVPWTQVAGGYH